MNTFLNQSIVLNLKRIEKWDSIYKEQNKRWNGLPSKLAETTLKYFFYNKEIEGIADIGGGYGRDSIYFMKYGYKVINIESSQTALAILRKDYQNSFSDESLSVMRADALEMSNYDFVSANNYLIFCNYFLHLLSVEELNTFLQNLITNLKKDTFVSFNLISKKDFRYNGNQIEEVEKDIQWSFWDKDDIANLMNNLSMNILFWEEEIEIEYINRQFDKVYSHFIIAEIK